MNDFTSVELNIINKALSFYKYEMNKTDDMDEYRTWKNVTKKFNGRLEFYRGVWSWKELEGCQR